MKKADVIQFVIIVVALVIGVSSMQYVFSAIVGLLYAIGSGGFNMTTSSITIVSILVTLLYAVICWQLLVKSKNIAAFIYEKANIDTPIKIVSQPADLLYVLLIVLAFYYLLQNLPALVKGSLNEFTRKAGSRFIPDSFEPPTDWAIIFVKLLLPLVLLIAGKPIANYFSQNVSDIPMTIGDDIEGFHENDTNEL